MSYKHTQRGGSTRYVAGTGLFFTAWGLLPWAPWARAHPWMLGIGILFLLLAACFARLTVRDAGEALTARFGPIPLFGTKIPYGEMGKVRIGISDWVDGSGVHWVPGRGWIYNLGPGPCLEIERKKKGKPSKTVRIGTDDPEELLAFVRRRLKEHRARN